MGTAELLEEVKAAGVTVTYSPDTDKLIARPTSRVTPEIVAALRERKGEVIQALHPKTTQAAELGLVSKWARTLGFVSIHDPTSGKWCDLQVADAPDWATREARKRKELYGEGNHKAYRLTAREMERILDKERTPDQEGIIEEHPVEEEV